MKTNPLPNTPTLAIYQTGKRTHFYSKQGTDNTLEGDEVILPAGTAIAIVRQGSNDQRKFLVQAGELHSWLWEDWIEPLEAKT